MQDSVTRNCTAIFFAMGIFSFSQIALAQPASSKDWASRAVAAVVSEDPKPLAELAEEYEKLSATEKGKLRLTVSKDAVDIEFDGTVEDEDSLGFAEYLLASAEKEYEAMMVATSDELARLEALRPFFVIHPREGRRKWWDAKILWTEGSKPKSVDVAELFGKNPPAELDPFLDGIEVDAQGLLGGESTSGKNLKADVTKAPLKMKAVLKLTLRREAKK